VSSVIEKVRAKLVANATVTALVGTDPGSRIYPQVAPQATAPPYLVLTVVSDVPETSMDGEDEETLCFARLQVDAYGKSYLSADTLAKAVRKVIAGLKAPDLSATRLGRRDLHDDETQLERVSQDFSVATSWE
jgi:hypothetical protein